MEYKDYYKILGIPRDAEPSAIKKAYRKLAREFHPDINKDAKAESRFKEINEANEVLSDPTKRQKYDQLGSSYSQWAQSGGQGGGFDWSEWMSRAQQSQGGRVRYDYSGGDAFSEFFESIFGGMPFATTGTRQRSVNFEDMIRGAGRQQGGRMGGRDLDTDVEITLEEAYNGTTRLLSKDGRRLQIRIPKGAKTGTKVRIAGEGSGQGGDLYLRVTVKPHEIFERTDDDLTEEVLIHLYTAVLGGEVQITTMAGKVMLKIPQGTQPGQVIRVRGKGMPKLRAPETFGDLYVRVEVEIPTELTAKERALFRELASFRD